MKTITFEKPLTNSPAFRSLSKWSILVFMDFLQKRKMKCIKRSAKRAGQWIITNNGEIVYPYSEAEKRCIGRREFRNAIDELVEKGFIDIVHRGSGGVTGDMSKYAISERWKNYGTPDYQPTKHPRIKDYRKDRGWALYHKRKKEPR